MGFTEFFDRVKHTPANPHTTVVLPDAAAAASGDEAGYFQVRLTDMYLTDARRWHEEIAPATFSWPISNTAPKLSASRFSSVISCCP